MDTELREVLRADPRVAFALETPHDDDVDIAIGLKSDSSFDSEDIGALAAALEHATDGDVNLLIVNEAPPRIAYYAFRDGHVIYEADRKIRVELESKAILEYLDFQPFEEMCTRGVEAAVFAANVAAIRDALDRIREVLPTSARELEKNRTAREVVTLNLFVAIQAALALAVYGLADEGRDVPQRYDDVFRALAKHGVIESALADRLAAASGLRNLIAHQYGSLDPTRLFAAATQSLGDLTAFTTALARKAGRS